VIAIFVIASLVLNTPYCYAGHTRGSSIERQREQQVINGYELPYKEEWTTGSFETHEWIVTGANWQIAGQFGNPSPCVSFTNPPLTTNYEQTLESAYLNGTGFVDGMIKFDFCLKRTTGNPSEAETLTVQVNSGGGWFQVAQYTNVEAFDWITQSFDITNIAKGNAFKVRFLAAGLNTTNIASWQIDNIHVYRLCEAPTELFITIPDLNHCNHFLIQWTGITGTGRGVSDWLFWDNGTKLMFIQTHLTMLLTLN
jgi:hypothetical protein